MTIASTITVDSGSVLKALESLGLNLTREIEIINFKVAKKAKSFVAKQVTKELAVTQRDVKALLTVHKKARSPAASGASENASELELVKTARLPLKRFKPRQTRKGVSYRISKSKGRRTAPSAFTATTLGGHVFAREGKDRKPIRKLYGPSPWGVHVINDQSDAVVPLINGELRRQMNDRLRYQNLKQSGVI